MLHLYLMLCLWSTLLLVVSMQMRVVLLMLLFYLQFVYSKQKTRVIFTLNYPVHVPPSLVFSLLKKQSLSYKKVTEDDGKVSGERREQI
ncbi:hypothetical protein Hanom_Chr10g00933981 [Helianthus anomalus]